MATLLALASVIPSGALFGQLVTGAVVERGSGSPVMGAVVRLVQPDGTPVRAVLTAVDGRYRLSGDLPGTYYLTVERIGYRDARVGPVDVAVGATVQRNIVLEIGALELPGLSVAGAPRRCDLTVGEADATQMVWSQVRTALDAASITSEEGSLSFRVRHRERRLRPGDLTLLDQSSDARWLRGGNSVRSLPAEELASGGYVRAAPDGSVEYYAPDARAILSDSFLARHCFTLEQATDEGGQDKLGLAFEPMKDRDTVDIAGVMWLDRATARLQSITFEYIGLPYQVSSGEAGGSIRYAELPDGHWIVEEWYIRAPAFRVVRSMTDRRQMVDAVYESGADVLSVRGSTFEWSPRVATATITGSVYDSTSSRPLSGAIVRVAGSTWRTLSDEEGRFHLSGLALGRYRVVFEHARLDSLGLPPLGQDVVLGSADAGTLALTIPSRATLLAETCPRGLGAIVVGWTTTSDGATRIPGARIRVEDEGGQQLATASSGADGAYQICGLPADRDVALVAELLGTRSDTARWRTSESTYHRADLHLDLTAPPETYDIEGVVVSVEARSVALSRVGYYDRKERIAGTFLGREELGVESAPRLSDALMRQPTIRRVDQASRTGNTTRRFIQFRRAVSVSARGQACMPAIYVDGALARQGQVLAPDDVGGYPTLDELVNAADIQGIELYESPSTIPAQFTGPGTLCGAIVVWTRR